MLERYYIEKEKQEKLLSRKNVKSDFYNGIYDRYEYPVLTRDRRQAADQPGCLRPEYRGQLPFRGRARSR